MKTITFRVRVFNPNTEREVSVNLYDNLQEILKENDEEAIVEIINQHCISIKRSEVRNEMINELQGKKHGK